MPPVGFKPTISAGKRPQTYVLDRAATGTGTLDICYSCETGITSKSARVSSINVLVNRDTQRSPCLELKN